MTALPPRLTALLGLLILSAVIWLGVKSSRAGVETAPYELLRREGDFELRRYPAMTGAATALAEEAGAGRNAGFGRLFRYLSGGNGREEKIAMTSPVFVETDGTAREKAMIFVMPRATASAGAPAPASPDVTVKTLPGGDFASLRFQGHRSKEAQRRALAGLRERIAAEGLRASGEPVFAYYDPPWIPEGLRRNEVLLRVAGAPAKP